MTIDKIHDIVRFYMNKDQVGYFSPEEIDAVLDRVQMEMIDSFLPVNRTDSKVYGNNQRIDDAVVLFKKTIDITTVASGDLSLPSDFMFMLSLTVLKSGSQVAVQVLNEEELRQRISSQVIPISTYPVGSMVSISGMSGIRVYPSAEYTGQLYYIQRPPAPKFAYTISGRQLLYDESNSVQMGWRDPEINKIINASLRYFGLNLGNDKV